MADFGPELEKLVEDEVAQINLTNQDVWTLIVELSSHFRGARLGVVPKSPLRDKIVRAIYLLRF